MVHHVVFPFSSTTTQLSLSIILSSRSIVYIEQRAHANSTGDDADQ